MHRTAAQVATAQAATILDVTRRHVVRLVEAGELVPTLKLPGKTGAYLFAREDIEALAESRAS